MATIVSSPGSARVGVKIDGYEDIMRTLDKLPIEIRGKELEKAGTKAVKRIEKRAKELVPVGDPRHKPEKPPLKKTIGTVVRRYQGGAVLAWLVGPEYPAGAHGHLVEHGTAPHAIPSKTGKTRQHPGAKPHPFMAPAAVDVAPQIERDIVEGLKRAVDKATSGG